MLGFLRSNTAPIAIDFGYAELKVLQVQPGTPGTVLAAASSEIPEHARADYHSRFAFLGEALPRLLREGQFKGKVAICSIPAWQSFFQHVQVSKSDGDDLTELVKAQLMAVVEFDPSNVVVRHVEVADVNRQGQHLTEVIAFLVGRDLVMRQLELVKKCRLEIGGFHAEPIAVLRAFDHIHRRQNDHLITTLYLDIGANCTKVMIAHGRDLRFARAVPVGSRHFDARLGEALKCDAHAARERRRVERTLARLAPAASPRVPVVVGGEAAATERRSGQLPSVLRDVPEAAPAGELHASTVELLDQLADEVRMCERYHRALFPDRAIDRAILVGGEAGDPRAARYLAQRLGLPAFAADPLKRFELAPDLRPIGPESLTGLPGWAVPAGLTQFEPQV